MGRDEVVRISRLVAFGGLTEMDINILLMNYWQPAAIILTRLGAESPLNTVWWQE